jgi:peroxiredoxin Q/BCP
VEAAAFRDEGPNLPKDVVILGLSKDSVEAQKKFAEKQRLTFRLLADKDGAVIRLYGVDGLLGMAKRQTFLVNSKGKIGGIFQKVIPAKHAAEVAEALKGVS